MYKIRMTVAAALLIVPAIAQADSDDRGEQRQRSGYSSSEHAGVQHQGMRMKEMRSNMRDKRQGMRSNMRDKRQGMRSNMRERR